jgi:glycosyltransferase involved in cell wall biosynthesis
MKTADSQPENWPEVSVIAPCRNEAGFVRQAIHSILENDYPVDRLEILVVDGMSTDGTRQIVQEIARQHPRIRLVDNPQEIVPTAMNIGIGEAGGEFIVRMDCHSRFATDYIRKCVEVSRETHAANVGGYLETLPGADTQMARAIMLASTSPFGVGNSAFRITGEKAKEADTVPFGAFRKALFAEVGLYDERLVRNQDIELNARLRKLGHKIIISPEIKLSYFNRATLRGIWQQSFNNGLWNPYTLWLTGRSLQLRHFIPLFFVVGVLAFSLGSFFHGVFRIGLVGLVALYVSVAFVAACRQRPRVHRTKIYKVMATFFVLHVAYGLGSLWGCLTFPFKFPRRNRSQVGRAQADRRY